MATETIVPEGLTTKPPVPRRGRRPRLRPESALSEEGEITLLRLAVEGVPVPVLSYAFALTPAAVRRIVRRGRWKVGVVDTRDEQLRLMGKLPPRKRALYAGEDDE